MIDPTEVDGGGPVPDVVSAQGLDGCIVGACGKSIVGRGRCRRHYSQWYRTTPRDQRTPALHLKRKTPTERFWAKVDRRGEDECWPWTGSRHKFGHGEFFISRERGKTPAHMYALEVSTGEGCPPGRETCHHCDNPPCCNPRHLYFGTRAENVADMHRRGRAVVGSRARNARLTEDQVVEIRERSAAGETNLSLAAAFKIGDSSISQIVHGHQWKHAGGPISPPRSSGRPPKKEAA